MIRHAHTYLAGAISGTALIGAAVVAFVLLVSLGALRDWPLAGIGGSGEEPTVSEDTPVAPSGARSALGATGAAAARVRGSGGSQRSDAGARLQGGDAAPVAPGSPATGTPAGEGPASSPPGGSDGANAPSSASAGAGGGKGTGSGSQSGTSGSGGQSTSGAVTETVNDTVSGVDKTLGGALGETGVTEVTEKAVNGVAGPESTVGKTVDSTVKAVGGLLGGNH